jgi:hypothetical protein
VIREGVRTHKLNAQTHMYAVQTHTCTRTHTHTHTHTHEQQWNATSRRFEVVKGLADIHELNGRERGRGRGE